MTAAIKYVKARPWHFLIPGVVLVSAGAWWFKDSIWSLFSENSEEEKSRKWEPELTVFDNIKALGSEYKYPLAAVALAGGAAAIAYKKKNAPQELTENVRDAVGACVGVEKGGSWGTILMSIFILAAIAAGILHVMGCLDVSPSPNSPNFQNGAQVIQERRGDLEAQWGDGDPDCRSYRASGQPDNIYVS